MGCTSFAIASLLLSLVIFSIPMKAEAAWIVKNGHLYDAEEVATLSLEEHFAIGGKAYQAKDWDEAVRQFRLITCSFPDTKLGKESHFYLGVSYFRVGEFEFANQEFTSYLKAQSNPKYFEESFSYKFMIAEEFKKGARRRIFGHRRMPKWLTGKKIAFDTYEEIISTLPCHELAAQALWAKAYLHWEIEEYKLGVEAFQTIIRRFPKHELAIESYLAINQLYLKQSQREFQNPDLLALAELNLKRFTQDFPGESRIEQAEQSVLTIKEVYAKGLYDTGQFYERIHQPNSSVIYYKSAIKQFPETSVAKLCYDRLTVLEPNTASKLLSLKNK